MPQIRQYEQQVSPTGPVDVQRATADTFGGQIGDAVKGLGGAIENASDVVYRRKVQSDLSDLDARMSDAHNDLGLKYQEQLQNGTLNHDDFVRTAQEKLEKVGEDIETPEAQNRFTQLKASTNLYFSQEAQKGQAQLAGVKAVADYKLAVQADSSSLTNNPQAFQPLLAKRLQTIDDMVATGALPAMKAPELKVEATDKYAEGAFRGLLMADPQEARDQLNEGKWDQYMGENTKYKMGVEIDRKERGNLIDEARRQKLEKEAADARQEQAKEKGLQMLYGNGLSTDWVLKNKDLDEGAKEHMLALIEKRQTAKEGSNPAVVKQLFAGIHNTDPSKRTLDQHDIENAFLAGDINEEKLKFLRNEVAGKGTLDGQNESILSNAVVKSAYTQIAKPDPNGIPDPKGQQQFNAWLFDFMKKKQEAKANNSFTNEMYNPASPKYLGSNFSSYQRSWEEILNDNAEKMSGKNAAGEEMVSAMSPDGKPVKLPKSKVDAARAAGKIK